MYISNDDLYLTFPIGTIWLVDSFWGQHQKLDSEWIDWMIIDLNSKWNILSFHGDDIQRHL